MEIYNFHYLHRCICEINYHVAALGSCWSAETKFSFPTRPPYGGNQLGIMWMQQLVPDCVMRCKCLLFTCGTYMLDNALQDALE